MPQTGQTITVVFSLPASKESVIHTVTHVGKSGFDAVGKPHWWKSGETNRVAVRYRVSSAQWYVVGRPTLRVIV